jgi:hypothetical protein
LGAPRGAPPDAAASPARSAGDLRAQPALEADLGLAVGADAEVRLDQRLLVRVQPVGEEPGQQVLHLAVPPATKSDHATHQ